MYFSDSVTFISLNLLSLFLLICYLYFSEFVMCISVIEIGNLAEFWLGPIYWEASQSGVSGVCTSLHFRPQPFRIDHYFDFWVLRRRKINSFVIHCICVCFYGIFVQVIGEVRITGTEYFCFLIYNLRGKIGLICTARNMISDENDSGHKNWHVDILRKKIYWHVDILT